MLPAGDTALNFELPGTEREEIDSYRLCGFTQDGPALLSVYPFEAPEFNPIREVVAAIDV